MSKKGLTTSVLGSHLGFDVPAVVRRAGAAPLHSVAPETSEPNEQGRAGTDVEAELPVAPSEPEPPRPAEPERPEHARGASVADGRISTSEEPTRDSEQDEDEVRALENEARRSASGSAARRKQPAKVESRSSVYRVGTQRSPYERSDGTKTEKAGFTAPHGFKEEINLFCLTHRLGTPSEWIVATLRKEMERTRRKS